jgi:hypothetical protein
MARSAHGDPILGQEKQRTDIGDRQTIADVYF